MGLAPREVRHWFQNRQSKVALDSWEENLQLDPE